MFCTLPIVADRSRYSLVLVAAMLLLSACSIGLVGARGTAVKQVRSFVESPEVSPELQRAYADLPTRVVFEYARALHRQGVKLTYKTDSAEAVGSTATRIIVDVGHKAEPPVTEREYRLLVDLEKDVKGSWQVTAIRALP